MSDSKETLFREAAEKVCTVVLGKETQVRELMLAVLTGGHVLMEDIPGVGKTTMALAFSRVLGLDYRRVQFTPDLLPSDLTGFNVYVREEEKFVYREGTVFCNLLLADEINRTSPKTQSALLEVMAERKVTVDGVTRPVPEPFLVIATENPYGSAGTQMLPESELDRFMISLELGYPDEASERKMAANLGMMRSAEQIEPVASKQDLMDAMREVEKVFISEEVLEYLVSLTRATRGDARLIRGVSPRASIHLAQMSQAAAWLDGRDYVRPSDVLEQFPHVTRHRLLLNRSARADGVSPDKIMDDIAASVPAPTIGKK